MLREKRPVVLSESGIDLIYDLELHALHLYHVSFSKLLTEFSNVSLPSWTIQNLILVGESFFGARARVWGSNSRPPKLPERPLLQIPQGVSSVILGSSQNHKIPRSTGCPIPIVTAHTIRVTTCAFDLLAQSSLLSFAKAGPPECPQHCSCVDLLKPAFLKPLRTIHDGTITRDTQDCRLRLVSRHCLTTGCDWYESWSR